MLGLLVACALAALLVFGAVGALRRGEVAVGDRVYRRSEPLFWLLCAGGLLGAGTIVATAAHAALSDEPTEGSRAIDVAGCRIVVPDAWEPLSDEESFPQGAPTLVLAGGGSELVVIAPAAVERTTTAPPSALADALRDPTIAYERWEARTTEQGMVVDTAYPSPRGAVRARHLIAADGAGTRAWTAVCSTQGDRGPCDRAIDSFALSLPGP